jgi:hypothetical protein
MASIWGTITLAELEEYACTDYSAISTDAGGTIKYTDVRVEAKISQAERWIKSVTQKTYDVNCVIEIKGAILEIGKQLMVNQMIEDGHLRDQSIIPITEFIMQNIVPMIANEINLGCIESFQNVEDY